MAGPEKNAVVAVIDDDPGMNKAIQRLLSAGGFQAVTFSCAELFLESERSGAVDCLVLDIHLPGISGFELCGHLRAAGSKLPVIIITAHDHASARNLAREHGAAAYFTKPFPGRSLLTAVSEALKLS
jgi:FixJ family two-component response regulator